MDSQDPRDAVSRIVAVLRKVTRIVQLAPFAFLLLIAVCLLLESMLPSWVLRIVDNGSILPLALFMLFLGKILKLCVWFRTACVLPVLARLESWIDSYVITFTQEEVIIINTVLGIIFLTYIYLANRHFFHGEQQGVS